MYRTKTEYHMYGRGVSSRNSEEEEVGGFNHMPDDDAGCTGLRQRRFPVLSSDRQGTAKVNELIRFHQTGVE
jgi:hypothetical protein